MKKVQEKKLVEAITNERGSFIRLIDSITLSLNDAKELHKQLGEAMEHIFVIEDLHNFGAYYDPTLMAWFQNFDRNWNELKEEYGERCFPRNSYE